MAPKTVHLSNMSSTISENRRELSVFMREHAINQKDKDCLSLLYAKSYLDAIRMERQRSATGRLMGAVPHVPTHVHAPNKFQLAHLPCKLDSLARVTIIRGHPGLNSSDLLIRSLIAHHSENGEKCRIICAQPNRLIAHTKAEFLATERNEQVGQAIGYQIRLESKVSPRTVLTFCTYRVLLRTMYADIGVLSGTSHVILDGLHDQLFHAATHKDMTCFENPDLFNIATVLSTLPECIRKFPQLKFILIANCNNSHPLVEVPRSLVAVDPTIYTVDAPIQDIKVVHLEQVLTWLNYWNTEMAQVESVIAKDQCHIAAMSRWLLQREERWKPEEFQSNPSGNNAALAHVDRLIEVIWYHNPRSEQENKLKNANSLLHCILSGWCRLDHQHSTSGLTALMVYAATGFSAQAEALLLHGSNPFIRFFLPVSLLKLSPYYEEHFPEQLSDVQHIGCSAYDFARIFNQPKCALIIKLHMTISYQNHIIENYEASLLRYRRVFPNPVLRFQKALPELLHEHASSESDKSWIPYLISRQIKNLPDTLVDINLILCLLEKIHTSLPPGNILLFLPCIESLITVRDSILSSLPLMARLQSEYSVPFDLRLDLAVQRSSPSTEYSDWNLGLIVFSIDLATSFVETAFALQDVAYVIDSGLNFRKRMNSFTGVQSGCYRWINSSSALFRRDKISIGMRGICFRLYSSVRSNLLGDDLGELDHSALALLSRYLAPPGKPADHFLRLTGCPIPTEKVLDTFNMLKAADIVNDFFELTELGYHICDLPIKPAYGKMVLVSITLKCLDPILTIACILNHTEPCSFLILEAPVKVKPKGS
ncbi:3'-5' RNA helicase ythdc2 [Cichlidogyrus casuarinus]|uniref:3'-5' RNA helicase ythdc2 n=1 Tax=Cichlidogyrus casuarinus TaxID=1844966 RepID=A0ABD2QHE3_9PLAT